MSEFLLPDVGEGLTEAEIVAWKVKVVVSISTEYYIISRTITKLGVSLIDIIPFSTKYYIISRTITKGGVSLIDIISAFAIN